ncbi:MAG: T9SS type A sorting domain-containing protein, partial [Candidatus Hatepunaea meridiana]|nr:T9SS type A sorting domain-containing protein [Candidatus Hatepunaea meridiana]
EGEALEIRLVDENGEYDFQFEVLEGNLGYETDGLTVIRLKSIEAMPIEFGIVSACPNPFNSNTVIRYSLPESGQVQLNLYDLQGRLALDLVNNELSAGAHSISLNGLKLVSGIYFIELQACDKISMMKVVLVK